MKITLYTTSSCPFCILEKEYLKSKNIHYEEILVDHDMEQAKKMIEISGQMGVPFTVIEKEKGEKVSILGFDRPRIDETLRINS